MVGLCRKRDAYTVDQANGHKNETASDPSPEKAGTGSGKVRPCCRFISQANLQPHKVVTEDGYVLTAFRVGQQNLEQSDFNGHKHDHEHVSSSTSQKKVPVLMITGLANNGKEWAFEAERESLPSMLTREGYDCWMGCIRGAPHSREHTSLRNSAKGKREFWDFSLDEIGKYDLPALIDYVLQTTGSEQLFFVGYSMGGALISITLNVRPGYANKVKAMSLLAPAVYGYDMKTLWNKIVFPVFSKLGRYRFMHLFGVAHKPTMSMVKRALFPFLCLKPLTSRMSAAFFKLSGLLFGYTVRGDGINLEVMGRISGVMPGSTSPKVVCHMAQLFTSSKFRAFDYGCRKNRKVYGSAEPPSYSLEKVTVPVATFTGNHDFLVPASGVARYSEEVPNLISHKCISSQKFSHLDFLFGKGSDALIYTDVVKIFNSFSGNLDHNPEPEGNWNGKVDNLKDDENQTGESVEVDVLARELEN